MAIERALISVTDKTGIIDFARFLSASGTEIISSGGTAEVLRKAGLTVTDVETFTGSPEVMDGRVKTLHPRIHGGISARDLPSDWSDLKTLGGRPIDLVIVNLYAFADAVRRGGTDASIIEQIDIGGPSLIRGAAKNHDRVTVVVEPADYQRIQEAIAQNTLGPVLRRELAGKAFAHTASYDARVASYFAAGALPDTLTLALERVGTELRYGENPHQRGAFYALDHAPAGSLNALVTHDLGSKQLSYNNLMDIDAALDVAIEFTEPGAVIIKHGTPSGVALGKSIEDAYLRAREADPESAFGGIVALNREVDIHAAHRLTETFLECIIAPSFAPAALAQLQTKKNLRLVSLSPWPSPTTPRLHVRGVRGGLLIQDHDVISSTEIESAKVVTARTPSPEEDRDLAFAWRVCKHAKSNAIVLAQGGCTVGIGAGQTSRVESVRTAISRAKHRTQGAVLASDAFFPFPDNIQLAAAAGIRAVIQPGGSVKDAEVITAANAAGIAMRFTGTRHFRHT